MSSIDVSTNIPSFPPPSNTPVPDTAPTTTSTEQTTPTTAPTEPYLSLPYQNLRLNAIGLSPPPAIADISVLLAQVGLSLDKLFDETQKEALKAQSENRRNMFGFALFFQESITTLSLRNTELTAQIATHQARVTEATNERNGLVSQRTGLQSQLSGVNNQITSTQNQINALNTQIANTTNPATLASLISQRNSLSAQLPGLQSQANSLTSQIGSLNSQIATLDAEIADLNVKIAAAEEEKAANTSTINSYNSILSVFASVVALAFSQSAEDLDRGMVGQSGLDMSLDEIVETIKSFDERFDAQKAFERFQTLREGDQESIQRLAVKVIALIVAVAEVLATLEGLEPPPSVDLQQDALASGSRLRLPA